MSVIRALPGVPMLFWHPLHPARAGDRLQRPRLRRLEGRHLSLIRRKWAAYRRRRQRGRPLSGSPLTGPDFVWFLSHVRVQLEEIDAGKEVLGGANHRQVERAREAAGPRTDGGQACKRIGISDQTFFRWRTRYGALKEDEAQRLRALEQENARLKRIVADLTLDISMLRELQNSKW